MPKCYNCQRDFSATELISFGGHNYCRDCEEQALRKATWQTVYNPIPVGKWQQQIKRKGRKR